MIGEISKIQLKNLLLILAPFAPHITEEIWRKCFKKASIYKATWPRYSPRLIKEKEIILIVQINGKVRDKIEVKADISEEKAKKLALASEKVRKWRGDKKIKKWYLFPEN